LQGAGRSMAEDHGSVRDLKESDNHGDREGSSDRASNQAVTQSFNKAEGGDGGDATSDIHTRSGRGGDALSLAQGACCPDSDKHGADHAMTRDGGDEHGSNRDGGVRAISHGGDSGDANTIASTTGGNGGDATAGSFGL